MNKWMSWLGCFGAIAAAGCAEHVPPDAARPAKVSATKVDGSQYLLTSEPEGAKTVIAVRESASDGDDVRVEGRIGGGENPWIEGRAAFTLVDRSLRACSDIPGDGCQTPWDYCCETDKLKTSTALVKIVDDNGDLVKAAARELLNVKELSTVIVEGTAQRDEDGNLTVLARHVYVKQK